MSNPEIEEFGRVVVEHIRDKAIRSNDRELKKTESQITKRWQQAFEKGGMESIAKTIIPDIVDDTIFYFLQAIDQELLKLLFIASNGKTVELEEDGLGELSGWYMGSKGWRFMFSKERFIDYCSDSYIDF